MGAVVVVVMRCFVLDFGLNVAAPEAACFPGLLDFVPPTPALFRDFPTLDPLSRCLDFRPGRKLDSSS